MQPIPATPELPVEKLAAIFNNVTNSYKFYWFLALLAHVKSGQSAVVPVDDLLAGMVAHVWYPVNYFYLSFGKQDRLPHIVFAIQEASPLLATSSKADVLRHVQHLLGAQSAVADAVRSLARFVPYRFVRPFFIDHLRGVPDGGVNESIAELATHAFESPEQPCLYRFVSIPQPAIEIHPRWLEYMERHVSVLEGFCLWHLLTYVQKNNPNVPNIAHKLFEPQQRNLREARQFWSVVSGTIGPLRCIYSGEMIAGDEFSIDHFLPWRFVAHDQLWNLIPTTKGVNSAKSDNLPRVDLYFERFARAQYEALQVATQGASGQRQKRLVEDYVLLFQKEEIGEVVALPYESFRDVLQNTIVPQMQIAQNMGFSANWRYTEP